jgi:hypothetical protein
LFNQKKIKQRISQKFMCLSGPAPLLVLATVRVLFIRINAPAGLLAELFDTYTCAIIALVILRTRPESSDKK